MFELTIEALENNPEQDFLGDIFMRLKLGNVFNGQFFTPYHLSALTAETMREAVLERLEEEAYISVNDPACGAGALLIAYRNMLKNAGVDWSGKAIFAAQDIDETTALMCYIQLSLLGCAGYVCIADSLRYPMTGDPLIPQIGKNQDYWFTPAYFSDVWTWRKMEALCR